MGRKAGVPANLRARSIGIPEINLSKVLILSISSWSKYLRVTIKVINPRQTITKF